MKRWQAFEKSKELGRQENCTIEAKKMGSEKWREGDGEKRKWAKDIIYTLRNKLVSQNTCFSPFVY